MCVVEVGSVHLYNNITLGYWSWRGHDGMLLVLLLVQIFEHKT